MNIKTRIKDGQYVVLQIETDSSTVTEDLATLRSGSGKWVVPENIIELFIEIANQCSRFNGTSDADFVKKICEAYPDDTEKA